MFHVCPVALDSANREIPSAVRPGAKGCGTSPRTTVAMPIPENVQTAKRRHYVSDARLERRGVADVAPQAKRAPTGLPVPRLPVTSHRVKNRARCMGS